MTGPEPPTVETLSSMPAFRGRLVRVRVDTVRLPGGRVTRREVVEHPGSVGIVAVDSARRVRLLRQHRHPARQVMLEIPAGLREPGEDAPACALRELREETGLEAARVEHLCGYYPSAGMSDEFIDLFLASRLRSLPEAPAPEEEILAQLDMPLEEAVEMAVAGGFRDAKTMLGVLLAARRLGA